MQKMLCTNFVCRTSKGLVINYWEGGRGYKTGGGASKALPLQKGGWGRKSFSHPEGRWGGGRTKCFGVVLTQVLEVLTILQERGTIQKASTLEKGRRRKMVFLVLSGGGGGTKSLGF